MKLNKATPMRDELDPVVLRHFALRQEPLAPGEFMSSLDQLLQQQRSGLGSSVVRGTFTGFALAIRTVARLRHVGLLALTGAALTVWALLA
jgi:hypothetical protein